MATAKRPMRWLWKVLALLVTAVGVSTAGTWIGTCPDPGECQILYAGGPTGWVIIAVCVVVLIVSLKQAYGRPGDQFP